MEDSLRSSHPGHLVLPKLIIPSIIMDYKGSSQRQDLEIPPRETSYYLAEPTDLETPQSRPTSDTTLDDLTSLVEPTCLETPWSGPTSWTTLDGLTSPAEPTCLETPWSGPTSWTTFDGLTSPAEPTDLETAQSRPTETSYDDLMSECFDELEKFVGPDFMSAILENPNAAVTWSIEDILSHVQSSLTQPFIETFSMDQNLGQDAIPCDSNSSYNFSTSLRTGCDSPKFDENDAALLEESYSTEDGCDVDGTTIDFNDPGNDVTSFELEDLGEDPFGLGELPDPATILGSDPGTAVFMFDANYDPNNNDDDELTWFPIDDLELFLV